MNSVNVLTQMDEITAKAGTADPEGIAAYLRADIVDVYSGDVIGYVQPIGRMQKQKTRHSYHARERSCGISSR